MDEIEEAISEVLQRVAAHDDGATHMVTQWYVIAKGFDKEGEDTIAVWSNDVPASDALGMLEAALIGVRKEIEDWWEEL